MREEIFFYILPQRLDLVTLLLEKKAKLDSDVVESVPEEKEILEEEKSEKIVEEMTTPEKIVKSAILLFVSLIVAVLVFISIFGYLFHRKRKIYHMNLRKL